MSAQEQPYDYLQRRIAKSRADGYPTTWVSHSEFEWLLSGLKPTTHMHLTHKAFKFGTQTVIQQPTSNIK